VGQAGAEQGCRHCRAGEPSEPSRGAAVAEPLEVGGHLMVDQQARCSSAP
jgi:hypothetical protein